MPHSGCAVALEWPSGSWRATCCFYSGVGTLDSGLFVYLRRIAGRKGDCEAKN